MPKNNEISFRSCFKLPNPGLRSYFDIVRKGQPDEYRTPFAKGHSVSKVLKDWQPYVDSLSDRWPTLVDFENDLKAKVGPMSVMKPLSERLKDIDHYYEDILLPSTPVSEQALKATISEFRGTKGILPRDQRRTVELMKKSTNSGSPFFTKRSTVTGKTLMVNVETSGDQVIQELNLHTYADVSSNVDVWNACAVLGWRGQEGGPSHDDVKQRVVWMFPYAVNIAELCVYQPLIESCQKLNTVPAWVSMEAVDQRITKMFDSKGRDDLVICTDFSKFDQHFNEDMQNAARTILSGLMTQCDTGDLWLNHVFPVKYVIPLAYDYGKIRTGKHGMGSGSGGTNADETLAHRALQYEAALANNSRLNPNSQCLGDDGVLTYPGATVEDVIRSYTAHGLEMNADKQYASTQDCVYLRRWHHRDYRINNVCAGVYSTYRALGRLMEQERYYDPESWSKEMVALRQLSIIENTNNHPLFGQFVDFCMKRDKYRLGLDIPGFLRRIDKIAKEATDLMPDFLGYTKSLQQERYRSKTGVSNWKVVQYLKSKR